MGGHRHARDFEHDAAARQDLRERRARAGSVFPGRRAVRGVLRGQEGQVPEADGRHASKDLIDLTIIVAGVERLTDTAPFLAEVRRQAHALPPRVEILTLQSWADGIGSALRREFLGSRRAYTTAADPDAAAAVT